MKKKKLNFANDAINFRVKLERDEEGGFIKCQLDRRMINSDVVVML